MGREGIFQAIMTSYRDSAFCLVGVSLSIFVLASTLQPSFAQNSPEQEPFGIQYPLPSQKNTPLKPVIRWNAWAPSMPGAPVTYNLIVSRRAPCDLSSAVTNTLVSSLFWDPGSFDLVPNSTYHICLTANAGLAGSKQAAFSSFTTRGDLSPARNLFTSPHTTSTQRAGNRSILVGGYNSEEGSMARVYMKSASGDLEMNVRRMHASADGKFFVPVMLPDRLPAGRYDFYIQFERPTQDGTPQTAISSPVTYWYDPAKSLNKPFVTKKASIGAFQIEPVDNARYYFIYRRVAYGFCEEPKPKPSPSTEPSPAPENIPERSCYRDSPFRFLASVVQPRPLASIDFQDNTLNDLPASDKQRGVSYFVIARRSSDESLASNIVTFDDSNTAPAVTPAAALAVISGSSGRSVEVLHCGKPLDEARSLAIDHSFDLTATLTWTPANECNSATFSSSRDIVSKSFKVDALNTVSRSQRSASACVIAGRISNLEPNTSYCFRSCMSDAQGHTSNTCWALTYKTQKDQTARSPFEISSLRASDSGEGLDVRWSVLDPDYVEERYIRYELRVEQNGEIIQNTVAAIDERRMRIEGLKTAENYCVSLWAVDREGSLVESSRGSVCSQTLDNRPRVEGVHILGYKLDEPYRVIVGFSVLDREESTFVTLESLEYRLDGGEWKLFNNHDLELAQPLRTSSFQNDASTNQLIINSLPYFSGEQRIELRFYLKKSPPGLLSSDTSTALERDFYALSESDSLTVFEGKTTTTQYARGSLSGCSLSAKASTASPSFDESEPSLTSLILFLLMTLFLAAWRHRLTNKLSSRRHRSIASSIRTGTLALTLLAPQWVYATISIDYPRQSMISPLRPEIIFSHRVERDESQTRYRIHLTTKANCYLEEPFLFSSTSRLTHTFQLPQGIRLREASTYRLCITTDERLYISSMITFTTLSETRVLPPTLLLHFPSRAISGQSAITLKGSAEPDSIYRVYQRWPSGPVLVASGVTNKTGEFFATIDVLNLHDSAGSRDYFATVERSGISTLVSVPSTPITYDYQPSIQLPAPQLTLASSTGAHFKWNAVAGVERYLVYRRHALTQCSVENQDRCYGIGIPYERVAQIDASQLSSYEFRDEEYKALRDSQLAQKLSCTSALCRTTFDRYLSEGVSYFVVSTSLDNGDRSLRSKSISFYDRTAPRLNTDTRTVYVTHPTTKLTQGFICGLGSKEYLDTDVDPSLTAIVYSTERSGAACSRSQFPTQLDPSSSPGVEILYQTLSFDTLTVASQERLAIDRCVPLGTVANLRETRPYCILTCFKDSAGNELKDSCAVSESHSAAERIAARFGGLLGLIPHASGEALTLWWSPPPKDEERAEVVRYELQVTHQFTDTGEPQFKIPTEDNQLISVGKDITKYTIEGLESGQRYCARVASIDSVGNRALNPRLFLCESTYDNVPKILHFSVGRSDDYVLTVFVAVKTRFRPIDGRRLTLQEPNGKLSLQLKTADSDWISVSPDDLEGPWSQLEGTLDEDKIAVNTLRLNTLPYTRNIEGLKFRVQVRDIPAIQGDEASLATAYESTWAQDAPVDLVDNRSLLASTSRSDFSGCQLNSHSSAPFGLLLWLVLTMILLWLQRTTKLSRPRATKPPTHADKA